jgi:amino acid transporter
MASYTITISMVLMRRLQGRKLPYARYSLGKWGVLVNILALIYIIPVFIFSFFPPTTNPTPDNMNWACAMFGGIIILATVYYIIWGRKQYTPPNETVEDYIERYQATASSSENVGGKPVVESVEGEKAMDTEGEKRMDMEGGK